MPGRISKHAFAVEPGRAETKYVRRRVGDTLDHDVEVHLLRDGRVRPGRRTMVRSELEREPGGRVVGRDDHEIVACVGDRVVQECGVEPRERSRVRTVEDDVVQASAHALNGPSRRPQLPHTARVYVAVGGLRDDLSGPGDHELEPLLGADRGEVVVFSGAPSRSQVVIAGPPAEKYCCRSIGAGRSCLREPGPRF